MDNCYAHPIQVIGWSMWFSEYLFLERSWAKDENTLKVWINIFYTYLYNNDASPYTFPEICTSFEYLCVHVPLLIPFWIFCCSYMQSGLQRLKDFPRPFWLALFVEGTRFTLPKLLAAQEYAGSQGLPIPRNVLIPRTKVKFSLHGFWIQFFHYFAFHLWAPFDPNPNKLINYFIRKWITENISHCWIRHLMLWLYFIQNSFWWSG